MTSKEILFDKLNQLYSGIYKINRSDIFKFINKIPENGNYYFYIDDNIHWIDISSKNLNSPIINCGELDEALSNRILSLIYKVTIKESFPVDNSKGISNILSIFVHFNREDEIRFGVDYLTGDNRFIQKNLRFIDLKYIVDYLKNNKPLPKKFNSGGFFDKLDKMAVFKSKDLLKDPFTSEISNEFKFGFNKLNSD